MICKQEGLQSPSISASNDKLNVRINRILIRNLIKMYYRINYSLQSNTDIDILFNQCRKYIEQDCMDNDRELLSNIR